MRGEGRGEVVSEDAGWWSGCRGSSGGEGSVSGGGEGRGSR